MPELTLQVSSTETPDLYVSHNGELSPAYAVQEGRADRGFYTLVYVHLQDGGTEVLTLEALGALAAEGRVFGPGPVFLPEVAGAPAGDGAAPEFDVTYEAAPALPGFALVVSRDGGPAERTTARELIRSGELTGPEERALAEMRPGQFMTIGGGVSGRAQRLVSRPMPRRRRADTKHAALYALFHSRVTSLHKITGEFAKEIRVRATLDATAHRVRNPDVPAAYRHAVESSKLLDQGGDWGTDEVEHALSFVEAELHHAGFDFDQADRAYQEREAKRAGVRSAWEEVSA